MSTAAADRATPLPPRWVIRLIWTVHRAAYRLTGGRFGLRTPAPDRWGMLRLTTVGRRSGRRRVAIVGYIEDRGTIVVPAMNGWADPEPAWWLNLQANPEATAELPGAGTREVVARAADGDEQRRLWAAFVALGSSAFTDGNAARRTRETALVILEPRSIAT